MEGTVLWDVCMLSDNKTWRHEMLAGIKEQRSNLKCTSDEDWIGGKLLVRNLIISTNRSKKVVVGFEKTQKTAYLDYITAQVIEQMLKKNQLECDRLIPVKLNKDANVPTGIDVLTTAEYAGEEDFMSKLVEALDDCDEVDTPCQVNVKNIILNGLKDESLREHLERNCSVNIIEDNEPVSDESFTEIEWDCYIVSCNDKWEANVRAKLKEKDKNLKVICRMDLISDISIKTRRKKIMDDDDVLGKLLQPVFKTKKTIVGFSGKINGYLTHTAEAAIDRQCFKGDFRGLIPVMIHRGAVIPFIAKELRPLKAFDTTFYEDVWNAVNEKWDCYIVSCDNEWEENVFYELKNRNDNLKLICRKDLMLKIPATKRRQKKIMDILLQPVHNTKKTIIGFSDTKVNTYLTYVTETLIKRQCKRGDDYGELIPVKIKHGAAIPFEWQFRPLEAFADTFDEDVWKAVNEITYDCYIVSCDNDWENEVSAELKERKNDLKLICRNELMPDISTKRTKKTLYYGGVFKTIMQPVLNSKKTIVGFSGKINGILKHVAEAVMDRQFHQGDDVAELIPVMIKEDTNIPYHIKQFRPLKAFEDTFYKDVLRAVIEIRVQVKVISNTSSAFAKEIEEVLHELVEDRQNQNVLDELTDYLKTMGLQLTRYTAGSIILHISAHDSAALKNLENGDVQAIIMSTLAKILPRKLQKEFCRKWSINIDKDKAGLTELETQPKETEKQPTGLKGKRIYKTFTQAKETEKQPTGLKRKRIYKTFTQAKETEKQPTGLKRKRKRYKTFTQDPLNRKSQKIKKTRIVDVSL